MNRTLVAALALVALPASLLAGKIKTVTVSTPTNYEKAQFQQAVVSNEGRVTLARSLRSLATKGPLDAARVWDVVEDRAGNLIVATGDEGKIFKVSPDGQVSLIFSSGDSQVLCLLAAADGSIYAGTGPTGTVIRIEPSGNTKVLQKLGAKYVWALVADDKDGALLAATGPQGRIYRIADGKSQVYFQCKQEHVLSLVRAADGTVYAGTDKQGLVYRVDAKGKSFVLFQAAQSEVRCLQLTEKALYVGTSSPSNGPGRGSSAGRDGGTGPGGLSSRQRNDPERASNGEKDKEPAATPPAHDRERDAERAPVSAGAGPGSGENSVYRVGLDGSAREVFREKGLVLSLLKAGDRLFVGTGAKGQLFEVNEATRERSEVARLDGAQVQRMAMRRDGSIVLATGDPGKLYVLEDRFVPSGTVTSEVIDARLISRWGAISWQGDTPAGTKLAVSVRSGNVAEPDESWSDWSTELIDPKAAAAQVPPARYFQFRVGLSTGNPSVTPALHHFTVRYATLNQAPEVTSLDAPTAEAAAAAKDPKKLKFKWVASDPNEDELIFDLFVRKDGWKDWVKIEDGWTKSEYEWDTTTMPTGEYRFKIVASDRSDNNEEEALAGERVSVPVAVAHEAPAVTLKLTGIDHGHAAFEAAAASSLVRLSSATFAVDGGKWQNLYPVDGLFDSKEEKFRFRSEALQPGAHVLLLRVRDAAGNVGSADVVFSVPRLDK